MSHPLPKAVLAQHTVILGKTRSGKSSTMRGLVEWLLDDKKPVCIIDPKGDWWGLKSSANGKKAGYEVVIFGGTHADVPINTHSGKVVAELVATGNRPCIIDLGGWMVGERSRFFIDFASTLFTRTHGHRWLCIDECHNFAPQGKIMDPDAGKMVHWANRLASEGAGKGLTLISASQRPQKVHKDYLTCHETLIAMRVIHPLDRGAMEDWIDGCGDPKKGAEVLNTLAGMQRGEGWVWSPEIDFGPKRIQFPMFRTYDSFAVQTGKAGRKLRGWASVNLDELKEKLAIVVEEAKANDPKELRAEVAKLKAEKVALERKLAVPAAPAKGGKPDKDAIEAAEQRGFERAKKQITAAAGREIKGAILAALDPIGQAVENAMRSARKQQTDAALDVQFMPSPAPAAPQMRPPVHQKPTLVQRLAPLSAGDGTFNGPQMKVLRSLAMWRALGHERPSRAMVAAVAGYSFSSGGFANLLGGLNTATAITYPSPGFVSLNVNGIDVMSREDGAAMLLSVLTNPQKKIIAAVADGDVHERAAVAEASGYSATSGGFANLLGSLSTLGIIVYPQPGSVQLEPWAHELLAGSIRAAA